MNAQNFNDPIERVFIYTIPSTLFDDPSLTLTDFKIYMIIRSFMDSPKGCFASNNWIANKLGVHRVTVVDTITKLTRKGYLTKKSVNGRRFIAVATNSIPLDEPLEIDQKASSRKTTTSSQETTTSSSETTPPSSQETTHIDLKKNNSIIYNTHSSEDEAVLPDDIFVQLPEKQPTPLKKKKSELQLFDLIENNPHNIPQDLIEDWITARKKKRSPVTPTVWQLLNINLSKIKNPIQAFEEMISRGWLTVKPEWLEDRFPRKEKLNMDDRSWIEPLFDGTHIF